MINFCHRTLYIWRKSLSLYICTLYIYVHVAHRECMMWLVQKTWSIFRLLHLYSFRTSSWGHWELFPDLPIVFSGSLSHARATGHDQARSLARSLVPRFIAKFQILIFAHARCTYTYLYVWILQKPASYTYIPYNTASYISIWWYHILGRLHLRLAIAYHTYTYYVWYVQGRYT